MPKRKPMIVGEYHFATKTAARQHVAQMLDRYDNGDRVVGDDEAFLHDLLDLHPHASEKVGCGVSHFTRQPDGRGGRCFWLWRTDGTHSDWSTAKALKLTGPRHDLLGALRCEVENQRNAFVSQRFAGDAQVVCAVTGQPLSRQEAHVDHHDPTFGQITREFLAQEGIGGGKPLPEVRDAGTRRYLADRTLAKRWQDYHSGRAVLRLTTPEANLRRKRGPNGT